MPPATASHAAASPALPARERSEPVVLRRYSALVPRVLVIGASTGGPQALTALLRGLGSSLSSLPVVVVLHMPAGFAGPVSEDLARITGLPCSVAESGERLLPGHVYLAGGGMHCKVIRFGDDALLVQSDAPPVHFCKPAVDVLFRSAAETYRAGVLGVILTGMGFDGLAGAETIVDAGGSIIAQDEASSVVWGMPGAVARAGLCSAVLPIEDIVASVASLLRGALPRSRP